MIREGKIAGQAILVGQHAEWVADAQLIREVGLYAAMGSRKVLRLVLKEWRLALGNHLRAEPFEIWNGPEQLIDFELELYLLEF